MYSKRREYTAECQSRFHINGCCAFAIGFFKQRSAPLVVIALSIHPISGYLPAVKCSVLHLQQSRWVLLCTHVCRWHFRFNTDSGRHEMYPLRFLSVLSSARNASWMISLWSEAKIKQRKLSIIVHQWNNRPIKITTRFSGSDVTGRH